jgi:hypothetical protein
MKAFVITHAGIAAATEEILRRGAMPQSYDIKAAIRRHAVPLRKTHRGEVPRRKNSGY